MTIQEWREYDRKQLDSDVEALLKQPAGRRVLVAMMGLGGVYASLGRRADAYEVGWRDAAAQVVRHCNQVAPEMVLLAQQERHNLSSQRKRDAEQERK